MRFTFGFLFIMCLVAVTSCRSNNPPPPADGVSVAAPGVRVNVSDTQGVSVAAPGTRIHVQPQ